jgi:hypothetical protein
MKTSLPTSPIKRGAREGGGGLLFSIHFGPLSFSTLTPSPLSCSVGDQHHRDLIGALVSMNFTHEQLPRNPDRTHNSR